MEKFKLNDLFHLTEDEMRKYKIHLAAYNGYEQPLDVFARDREEWKGWNEWRGGKDDSTSPPVVQQYRHRTRTENRPL